MIDDAIIAAQTPADDFTIDQVWSAYTAEEHAIWDLLYERQKNLLRGDIFHDIFGHVPLLTHSVFADYMQAYGKGGLRSLEYDTLKNLARLYWYTVEFGLIQTPEGLRHYGAGIVSSFGEAQYSLEDKSPHHIEFDLMRIMKTNYKIDDYQDCYFVINSFDQLFESTQISFKKEL